MRNGFEKRLSRLEKRMLGRTEAKVCNCRVSSWLLDFRCQLRDKEKQLSAQRPSRPRFRPFQLLRVPYL